MVGVVKVIITLLLLLLLLLIIIIIIIIIIVVVVVVVVVVVNAIRTNHIKTRIDKTLQNSKCRLCGEGNETINHIISECSKLAQKEYKTRHVWVGKVIHWEMYKKFKFDQTNNWYMHNQASVLENDTHKLLWDFDVKTDRLISARRPDLIIINNKKKKKRTCKIVDFVNHRVKLKENEKRNKSIVYRKLQGL